MFLRSMLVGPLAIFLTFLALGWTSLPPVNRYATVNGTVKLTVKLEPDCVVIYTRTLTELYGDDIEVTVVEQGKPTGIYKDKVKISGHVITLHEAEYNNRGVYELVCGIIEKKVVEVIKLEMFGPINSIVNAEEGENGVYTFYEDTNGRTDIQVHLQKLVNGSFEKRVKIPKTAGNAGTGFQGRAFLTDDGRTGRFSLNITNINHSDQGTFVIIVSGMYKETRHTLLKSAFQIQVRGKTRPSESSTHLVIIKVLVIILSLIVIGCVIVYLLTRNGCISEDQILAGIRRIQVEQLSNPIPEVSYEQVSHQDDTQIKNGLQEGEHSSSVEPIDSN